MHRYRSCRSHFFGWRHDRLNFRRHRLYVSLSNRRHGFLDRYNLIAGRTPHLSRRLVFLFAQIQIIRRLPHELTIPQFTGRVEIVIEIERRSVNAFEQQPLDDIKAIRLALAPRVDATKFGHDLLDDLILEGDVHRPRKIGSIAVLRRCPNVRIVRDVVFNRLPHTMPDGTTGNTESLIDIFDKCLVREDDFLIKGDLLFHPAEPILLVEQGAAIALIEGFEL